MTQTDELVAGRELDMLVAEKIFGHGETGFGGRREYYRHSIGTAGHPSPDPYSTEIAAAWQIVEHIATQWATSDDHGRYQRFREVVHAIAAGDPLLLDASEMAFAICRAALAVTR